MPNNRPIRIEGEIAYVPLTKGYEAVIDAADILLVRSFNWFARVAKKSDGSIRAVYAQTNGPKTTMGHRKTLLMHRVIIGASDGDAVDHKNGDGLNNTRVNIRSATPGQNACNRKPRSDNASGLKGVNFRPQRGSWCARIMVAGRPTYLGTFATPDEAALAYENASRQLHGEFGRAR